MGVSEEEAGGRSTGAARMSARRGGANYFIRDRISHQVQNPTITCLT